MNVIDGLQTRGIFCCHCQVEPDRVTAALLWLRDAELAGRQVNLVNSAGEDRYLVILPTGLEFENENVVMPRVAV